MLLDTNAYTALDNGQEPVSSMVRTADRLALPLPVIAELRYGFMKGIRQDTNEHKLQKFLASANVEVLTPDYKTTHAYAQVALFCRLKGRTLSNNDIWIAALAQQHQLPLLTRDHDFAPLGDSVLGPLLRLVD